MAQAPAATNPFLLEFNTTFKVPPFAEIRAEHFMPAFEEGIRQQQQRIGAITMQRSVPTFENTVAALEKSGDLLRNVSAVFFNLTSANTNPDLEGISRQIAPKMAQNSDDIYLNPALFLRVKTVYDKRNALQLTPEQHRLLEKTYKAFVRSGANLDAAKQARMREINKETSLLTVKFGQHLLAETNQFELIVDNEADLAGLPASLKTAAAISAKEAGKEGKWRFTLHNASVMPFLQYSANRPLREKMYKAYINRCNNNDERDNKEIVGQLASLRAEKAGMLGYASHADFVLEENMAKTPAQANDLLNRLWEAALPVAKNEAAEMQQVMDRESKGEKLEAWDWSYLPTKCARKSTTTTPKNCARISSWRTCGKGSSPWRKNSTALHSPN